MSMIDTTAILSSLAAARATATGANAVLLDEAITSITRKAADLTARWSSAMDASKTAWLSEAGAVFAAAQVAANFVVTSSGGTPASPLSFDPYSSTAIVARVDDAKQRASTPFLGHVLSVHATTLATVFNAGTAGTSALYLSPIIVPGDLPRGTKLAPAGLERELHALILDAATLLDSL